MEYKRMEGLTQIHRTLLKPSDKGISRRYGIMIIHKEEKVTRNCKTLCTIKRGKVSVEKCSCSFRVDGLASR